MSETTTQVHVMIMCMCALVRSSVALIVGTLGLRCVLFLQLSRGNCDSQVLRNKKFGMFGLAKCTLFLHKYMSLSRRPRHLASARCPWRLARSWSALDARFTESRNPQRFMSSHRRQESWLADSLGPRCVVQMETSVERCIRP